MRFNPIKAQRGFGLVHIVVIGLFLGLGSLAAFKIGKPYGDAQIIQKIAERTLLAAKDEPTMTANEIAKKIFDQANVQSISLDGENIQVKLIGISEYSVKVDMPTKIPLWQGAFLLIELKAQTQTK